MKYKTKVKVKLIGQDGNIFNLTGIVMSALRQAGYRDLAKELPTEIMKCNSYEEALCKLGEYVIIH